MERTECDRTDAKEIDKHFLKRVAASPGIVIGKAYVFEDVLLISL
ncbi:MAG: hypothetical protein A4E63_01465 [Syntrophorhabdus sp. PtaU1.Bin050]|nr:MAG: hypothetical protein A4E63_01465 [Syntrophorhabdus sp. PtaU1.Bin050]